MVRFDIQWDLSVGLVVREEVKEEMQLGTKWQDNMAHYVEEETRDCWGRVSRGHTLLGWRMFCLRIVWGSALMGADQRPEGLLALQ